MQTWVSESLSQQRRLHQTEFLLNLGYDLEVDIDILYDRITISERRLQKDLDQILMNIEMFGSRTEPRAFP